MAAKTVPRRGSSSIVWEDDGVTVFCLKRVNSVGESKYIHTDNKQKGSSSPSCLFPVSFSRQSSAYSVGVFLQRCIHLIIVEPHKHGDPLQYSCLGSILAWGIPGTEEPSRSQRVRHN